MTTAGRLLGAVIGAALAWVALFGAMPDAAASTRAARGVELTQTLVTLNLDSAEAVRIKPRTQVEPPAILIEFPERKVIGSLPERSAVGTGVVRTITAQYFPIRRGDGHRFLKAIELQLSELYPFEAWSEPGHILVRIEHPVSVAGTSVELGPKSGIIIGRLGESYLHARFQAMQAALTDATLITVANQHAPPVGGVSQLAAASASEVPQIPDHALAAPHQQMVPNAPAQAKPGAWWILVLVLLGGGLAFYRMRRPRVAAARLQAPSPGLLDELIWRAFEQRGYQLQDTSRIEDPLGTFRIITQQDARQGLLCLWEDRLVDRRTVEAFGRVLRRERLAAGILVATGMCTVPARRAAEHLGIAIIAREALVELLRLGAATESLSRQLAASQAQLEEAKEGLARYSIELDVLRRQRNEASWYLGAERVRAAQLESQLAAVGDELQRHEESLRSWEHEVATARKQWEESQWYLGEARARVKHLEAQLSVLSQMPVRLSEAERGREEASWYLREERLRREALAEEVKALRQAHEASQQRESALREALEIARREMERIRTVGERRRVARWAPDGVAVEIRNGDGRPLFAGRPRDVSSTGLGLFTGEALPSGPLRATFRIPGHPEPVGASLNAVWQRGTSDEGYHSGWAFADGVPEALEGIMADSPAA